MAILLVAWCRNGQMATAVWYGLLAELVIYSSIYVIRQPLYITIQNRL